MAGAPPPPEGQIPGFRSLVVNYLGPSLLAAPLQAIETGIIINQSFRFWLQAHNEKRVVKILVAFVTIVAIFQTVTSMVDVWTRFINNFGDLPGAFSIPTGQKIQPIVTVLMAAPVQAFLIWRCWVLTQHSFLLLVPLVVLHLGSIVSAILINITVFKTDFNAIVDPQPDQPQPVTVPIDPAFLSSLVFPATLDLLVTAVLLWFLLWSRSEVVTRRFRKVLNRLAVIVWEAAVPPSICAVVTVATYLTVKDFSFWDLLFQAVLGQLYVISLFVTVNGFRKVKTKDMGRGATTVLGRSWRPDTNDIRIEMRSPDDDSGSYPSDGAFFSRHIQSAPVIELRRLDNADVVPTKVDLEMAKDKLQHLESDGEGPITPT